MNESDLDQTIKTMAALQNIPLSEEMLPHVRLHLEIATRMARNLLEFEMDEREEPASVFAA